MSDKTEQEKTSESVLNAMRRFWQRLLGLEQAKVEQLTTERDRLKELYRLSEDDRGKWITRCNNTEYERDALIAERDRLRQEVVFGFYEEEKPLFAQGYNGIGGCELAEPVTAAEIQGYVDQISRLREALDKADQTLQGVIYSQSTVDADLARICLARIREVMEPAETQPSGQDRRVE